MEGELRPWTSLNTSEVSQRAMNLLFPRQFMSINCQQSARELMSYRALKPERGNPVVAFVGLIALHFPLDAILTSGAAHFERVEDKFSPEQTYKFSGSVSTVCSYMCGGFAKFNFENDALIMIVFLSRLCFGD
jgi:hypothetical protein